MTPIESTYSIAVDSKLDWESLGRILATGHSRIPVYSGDSKNLIGLLLVKSLITVHAEDEMPVSAMSIRKLPCVTADTPLYDMLNEFQKGHSHMAAVVSVADGRFIKTADHHKDFPLSDDHPKDNNKALPEHFEHSPTHIKDINRRVESDAAKDEWKVNILHEGSQTICKLEKPNSGTEVKRDSLRKSCVAAQEEGEIIGIITLEDVFEELIQEEILDETDEYVDVHRRIRVTSGVPPLSNSAAVQHGLPTIGKSQSVKWGGKSSKKLKNPPFANGGQSIRQPLLEKT